MSIDRGRATCCSAWTGSSRSSPRWRACSARWAAPRPPTDPAPLVDGRDGDRAEAARASGAPGLTWDGSSREMDEKLRYPGMPNLCWMPIQTRTEMLSTGIRSQLGDQGLRRRPRRRSSARRSAIEQVLADVPGTRSAFAERLTGGFYLDVRRRPRGGRAPRAARARRQRGRRDGDRRHERLADRRGPRALPDQRALRARVPRGPRRPAPRAGARRRRAPRSRSPRSPTIEFATGPPLCAARTASSSASSSSTSAERADRRLRRATRGAPWPSR